MTRHSSLEGQSDNPTLIHNSSPPSFPNQSNMDEEEYHHALMHRKRRFARGWLLTLQRSATLTTPHADYPFPEGFPFSETPIRATFSWNEFYGGELQHSVPIAFEFTRIPPGPQTPPELQVPSTRITWTVTSLNDNTILGFFEIDPRIFLDNHRLILLDANLILDGMLTSLQRGRFVELSSRVIAEEPSLVNCHYPFLNRNIEIFEIRTPEGDLLQELGRRWIRQRKCDTCDCWIPPTGPRLCLQHIFERGGQ